MFLCIKLQNRSEFTLKGLAGAWPPFWKEGQIYQKKAQNANSKFYVIHDWAIAITWAANCANMDQSERMGVVHTSDPPSACVWITVLANFKPYLLLLLIHMSLLLLNFFQLNFVFSIMFFPRKSSNLWKLVVTYSWYT